MLPPRAPLQPKDSLNPESTDPVKAINIEIPNSPAISDPKTQTLHRKLYLGAVELSFQQLLDHLWPECFITDEGVLRFTDS